MTTPGTKAWALVQHVLTVAKGYGANPLVLRRRLGHDAGDGVRPAPTNLRVPIDRVFALWADLAQLARDPALPLRVAEALRLEDLEIFGFSAMTAPSGAEAFARAIRYTPLITSAGRWSSELDGDVVRVHWLRSGDRWLGHRLTNESGVAQFVACMRQVYGPGLALERVTFRHRAPADVAAHRAFFRCPVEFGEAGDGFVFTRRSLDVAPPMANGALGAYLQKQAEQQLRMSESPSLASSLRTLLERDVQAGELAPSAARGARALGISERTLRRRLQLENTSFRAVVNDVQRSAAETLLAHGTESITDVALRVGFADTSAFSHAVRRWFGRSAREMREQARARK